MMTIPKQENYYPEEVRETKWWILFVFYAGHILFLFLSNTAAWYEQLSAFVEKATGGIINDTLIFSLVAYFFLIVGVVWLFGRLRPRDVGFTRKSLISGVGAIVIIWALPQVAGIIYQLLVNDNVAPIAFWQENKITMIVGHLIAQLFGNAFFEETAYRGFIFVQLKKKLQGQISQKYTFIGAVIISAALFALMHLPVLWMYDASITNMLMKFAVTFIGGIILALLFHRTSNLFFVIGVHALLNVPASIFISNLASVMMTLILSIIFAFRYQKHPDYADLC